MDAEYYLNKGRDHLYAGLLKEAIADFTKAIELKPDFADAYSNRGLCYRDLKEYQQAITDFTKAIELKPDHAIAYSNRGLCYRDLKAYQQAITDFTKAIELKPDHADAHYNRGLCYSDLEAYQQAIADFTKAIELKPDFAIAYYYRGIVYKYLNQIIEAQRNLTRFVFLSDEQELIRVLSSVLSFIKDNSNAPYLLKSIYKRLPLLNNLLSYQELVVTNKLQCETLDLYLNYLSYKKYDNTHPQLYYQINSIIHYYMGDSIEAFKLYDEVLDKDYDLSLWEQYYYVKSAIDILEPVENLKLISNETLKQAQSYLQQFQNSDVVELYYGGMIFYIHQRMIEAHQCFTKADSFLPALYMQVIRSIESSLTHTINYLGKLSEIRKRESLLLPDKGYLNGIHSQILSGDPNKDLPLFLTYAHHMEISQAIAEVRTNDDAPFKYLEFYEAFNFQLDPTELLNVKNYIRDKKIERCNKRILEHFNSYLKTGKNDNYIANEMNGKANEIYRTFEDLKMDEEKGKDMEIALARIIADLKFSRYDEHFEPIYFDMILYFHLRKKLNLKQTFTLIYYVIYISRLHQLYLQTDQQKAIENLKEGTLEGTIDTAKEYTKNVLSSSSWLVVLPIPALIATCFFPGIIVKTLMNFALQSLYKIKKEGKLNSNAVAMYYDFKQQLDKNFSHILQFGPNQFIDEFSIEEYKLVQQQIEELEDKNLY